MAMEKECYQQIKQQEQCALNERNQLEEDQLQSNFKLEKTLHDKAREKYKQDLEKKYVDSDKDAIKGLFFLTRRLLVPVPEEHGLSRPDAHQTGGHRDQGLNHDQVEGAPPQQGRYHPEEARVRAPEPRTQGAESFEKR